MPSPSLMMAVPYLLGASAATALLTAAGVRLFFRRGRSYLHAETLPRS